MKNIFKHSQAEKRTLRHFAMTEAVVAFGAAPSILHDLSLYKSIPQGRCGLASPLQDAVLHTESFTTCHVIVCCNSQTQQGALIHFDCHLLAYFGEVVSVIDKVAPDLVKLFYKPSHVPRSALHANLHAAFAQFLPHCKLEWVAVGDEVEGVAFNPTAGTCFVKEVLEFSPLVSCHPLNRKYVVIRAIEVFVGKRAVRETGLVTKRQFVLYDGTQWVKSQNASEFSIDDSHPLTKEDLSFFSRDDSIFKLFKNRERIMNLCGLPAQDRGELFKSCSFALHCLEDYLCNFEPNAQQIFIRNMLAVINSAPGKHLKSGVLKEIKRRLCLGIINLDDVLNEESGAGQYYFTLQQHCQRRVMCAIRECSYK